MPSSDILIIGAGTNGMACAARLAQAGHRVALVEAAPAPGGGAGTVEFAPGYRASALAHLLTGLDARVADGMGLSRHGLRTVPLATTALSAEGRHLRLEGATGEGIGGDLAGNDAANWPVLRQRLVDFATALAPLREMTPPAMGRGGGNDWARLARLGLDIRRMGRERFRELLRVILTNVADVLEDELEDDRLRGALAFDTVLGGWIGPRSPNSLILLLNRLAVGQGAVLLPPDGMGAVATAMAAHLAAEGVTIRCDSPVARVLVADDRARGVRLEGGEELHADAVFAAIPPGVTFRQLVGPAPLDAGFHARAGHIRARGGAALLRLALTAAPDFGGADLRTRLVIAPSVDAVERAFNAVKYGEVPDRPVMEVILPSAHGAGFAPEGHHVLSAIVQFAPHDPVAGQDASRAQMLENALRVLEDHAPGLRRLIAHAELMMPHDIAAKFRIPGGNWHHADLAVEQMLFLRPMPEAAQYATPLPGLWLAGAGSHPGGGISGAAGWNAAQAFLKAEARR